jgi:Domain of Unknown Function with PDB structure (DUF3857)
MQWRVGDTTALYVHRAVMINDVASLNTAGQLSVQFVPQYQRLQLHAIRVLPAGKSEDRTSSSTIRFLQRETGLERGVYSGVVTASILVNDLESAIRSSFRTRCSGKIPCSAASSSARPSGIKDIRHCFGESFSPIQQQER